MMHRDFEWLLHSPMLMQLPDGLLPFSSVINDALVNNPQLTPDRIEALSASFVSPQDSYKLGLYYEELVNHILNNSTYIYDLKRNIKVFSNKITLGEYDFIGRAQQGDFHLECAVKFYLRVGSGNRLEDYIGPGKKDRLDIKWQRMLNHQLALSNTPAGLAQCQQYGLQPSLRALLLQGYLFHPFAEGCPAHLADGINPKHLQGWWIRTSELSLIESDALFIEMKKPYWLSPVIEQPLDFTALASLAATKRSPVLVCRVKNGAAGWYELDRGFIVPEDW